MSEQKFRVATGSAGDMKNYELWSDGSFTFRQDTTVHGQFGPLIVAGAQRETHAIPYGLRWYLERSEPAYHATVTMWLAPFNPSWVGVYEAKVTA